MAILYAPTPCTFWLRSRSLVGLKHGDLVSQWNDSSGFGRTFTASGAGRPTYKDNDGGSLTGKPYVYFDGANNFMLGPTLDQFFAVGSGTLYIVARVDTVTANNATTNQNPALFGSNTSAQAVGLFVKNVSATNKQVLAWNHDGATGVSASFSLIEQAWGNWHAYVFLHGFGAVWMGVDYNPLQLPSAACGNSAQLNTVTALGRNYQQTQYFQGGIGEVLGFGASAHTGAQISQVLQYLRAEWQG